MNPIEERIAKALAEVNPEAEEMTLSCAEKVVGLCRIKGLTAEDVVRGTSPKDIAMLWMRRRMTAGTGTKDEGTTGRRYALLPFSKIVYDAIRRDEAAADVWNFPILLRAKESDIDAERLRAAVEKAVAHHPVFSMRIDDNGEQVFEQGYRSPYLTAEVYSKEGYVYLSLTLNRILGDATSFVLLAQNIWRAYRGDALPHDGYLQYLRQYEEQARSSVYAEHRQWLQEHYGHPSCPLLPQQDSAEGLLTGDAAEPIDILPDYAEQLAAFSRRQHVSVNAFYCLAAALAIMDYNGTDEAGLTWAYLGRESREQLSIFGSLHRDIPMILVRQCGQPLKEQLRRQMEQGIIHSDYPFTLFSAADSPWHSAVNVLVQPSIAEAMEGCPAEFEFVPVERSHESYCMLDIDIATAPLCLTFNYSPRYYKKESIHRFAALVDKNAKHLLNQ